MSASELHERSPGSEPRVRGTVRAYWIAQGGEFLRHHFETETRSRIEQAFSADLSTALSGLSMSDWVSRSHLVELLEATAKARRSSDAFADLVAFGEFIEQRATNRFTDLLTKILTPELMLRKLPLFWRRDHGLPGACVIDACAPGSARFHLEDVGDFPHIAPVWLGWVRASLASVHARSAEVKQSGYGAATPSPARVEFEVSWR
ncbi:MAG TPA: hypothetical protein VER11_04465 [Polyangiaceae bacterium]|nr:hypothetical protein [Polyangiaceae bacterium]